MKKTTMILMVAGGLTLPAVAANPTHHTSASGNSATGSIEMQKGAQNYHSTVGSPFLGIKAAPSTTIERYGDLSSQPWTQRVGWPQSSPFVDQQVYEPHFNLFWIGETPP